MKTYTIIFLFGYFMLKESFANVGDISRKLCQDKTTCGSCIAANPSCTWCHDEDFDDSDPTASRCDWATEWKSRCKKFENPEKSFRATKNKTLSNPGAEVENMVQLAPQEVNLKIRPGQAHVMSVNFRQARDYPVDLYYMMDLSQSMSVHKKQLASLGSKLATAMKEITRNFRLGFGSYVDKVASPFVSTVKERLENPCIDNKVSCARPYGFKNHMPLDTNTNLFEEKVKLAPMSGNIDTPEGVLDAIMQAIVCEKQVAWRNVSRKLLVISTDAGYHIGGDGKLAGIVVPNDGECHLNEYDVYDGLDQDYPSVGHLKEVVDMKKVHLIFAVLESQLDVYNNLATRLEGSGVGVLDRKSTNVVELVRDQYKKISSKVIMKDNVGSDIRVTYFSNCLNSSRPKEETDVCEHLKVGDNVKFDVTIEVKNCPADKKLWKKQFKIWPQGIDEELVVNLEILCECNCEQDQNIESNSNRCTLGNGTRACGICMCNKNRYGRNCECGTDIVNSDTVDKKSCTKPNSSVSCSGIGKCVCGVCDCSMTGKHGRQFSGKYCDCDDFSCGPHKNNMCNGHGTCVCGECKCDFGWSGTNCECSDNKHTCLAPGADPKNLCSGNGECLCGRCHCKETPEGRYIGEFCQECPGCSGQCETYWACVVCQEPFDADKRDICANFTCHVNVTLVEELETVQTTERYCVKKDYDSCKVVYKYGDDGLGNYYVQAQKSKKDCPTEVNIALIAAAVTGAVVAIGVCLLLIWKVLTTIHDRREFAKFENERLLAKWDKSENPIYKPSTSTFNNPTYTN